MKKRIKILFFTPYATRTGSEMMLLYLLKHLDRSRFEAGLVSFARGEMLSEVPEDIPVFIGPGRYTLWQKVCFHLGFHPMDHFLDSVNRRFGADVWYVNTVMLSEVVKGARRRSIRLITHIHELSHMYSFVDEGDYRHILDDSDLLLGCSESVCDNLRVSGGRQVQKLLSFMDLDSIRPSAARVESLRGEWGVKPGDRVWIMSGTTSERKGFDLLPEVAQVLNDASVHLVWVGRASYDGLVYLTRKRCEQIETTQIHLVGAQKEEYYSYLAAADGFMLLSRQEPLGLVLVEAAWLGKPIVAFSSGGPSEVILEGMGTVVPNLDVEAFVKAMRYWDAHPEAYDAELARRRAQEFGTGPGMKHWQHMLDEFCKEL